MLVNCAFRVYRSMHTGLEDPSIIGGNLDHLAMFMAERAKGNVGMMVTGGVSPNIEGLTGAGAGMMASDDDAALHKVVTDAVHAEGGVIAMQILHTGRNGYHKNIVSSSTQRSPISPLAPRMMSGNDILRTIDDFVSCATLARKAGYDGKNAMFV